MRGIRDLACDGRSVSQSGCDLRSGRGHYGKGPRLVLLMGSLLVLLGGRWLAAAEPFAGPVPVLQGEQPAPPATYINPGAQWTRWPGPHVVDDDLHMFEIRSGLVFPLGGDTYADRLKTGWGIQATFREPLPRYGLDTDWLVDFGGGYIGQKGEGGPVTVPGVFFADGDQFSPADDHVHPEQEFFEVRLSRLQRAGIHAGLSRIMPIDFLSDRLGRQVVLTGRGGGRLGHVRAEVDKRATPALQEIMDDHEGHGHNPDLFRLNPDLDTSDTYLGLYGGLGLGVVWKDVHCHGSSWYVGDVILGIDGEFLYDWFDLDGIGRDSDGVGNAALLFSVTVVR